MLPTGWRHIIHIHFLPEKKFAIAYFRGKMNYEYYQMMMLMGTFHSSRFLSMASWGQTWARPMFFCLVCCIPPLGASPALPDMSSRGTCKPLVSFIFSSHMTNPSLRSSHTLLTQPVSGYSIPHSQPLYGSALNRFRLWPIYHWGPWAALAVVMVGGIVAFRGCLETRKMAQPGKSSFPRSAVPSGDLSLPPPSAH